MSIWSVTVPWLAVKPAVRFQDGVLSARTPFLLRLASLFAYDRNLHVDTVRRYVHLAVRSYWFWREEQHLPFAAVEFIEYQYGHLPTDLGPSAHGAQVMDRADWFTVALRIRGTPNPLRLFRFAGEGSDATGISGTLLGDSVIDVQGDQESASRDFVGLLRRCLGVPVRSHLEHAVAKTMEKNARPCPLCARRIASTASRCVYCGTKFPKAAAR
jgi:hypothetical protein